MNQLESKLKKGSTHEKRAKEGYVTLKRSFVQFVHRLSRPADPSSKVDPRTKKYERKVVAKKKERCMLMLTKTKRDRLSPSHTHGAWRQEQLLRPLTLSISKNFRGASLYFFFTALTRLTGQPVVGREIETGKEREIETTRKVKGGGSLGTIRMQWTRMMLCDGAWLVESTTAETGANQ